MSRTRTVLLDGTDRDQVLETVAYTVLEENATERKKCFKMLQELFQNMMNRFDDVNDLTTDHEAVFAAAVSKFCAAARLYKARHRHFKKVGHRLTQSNSETCNLSAANQAIPGPETVPAAAAEKEDLSTSSSGFPDIDDKNNSTTHASAALSPNTEAGGVASSTQLGTGDNPTRSQLYDDLVARNPTQKRSRAEHYAFKKELEDQLKKLNTVRPRNALKADYVAEFGDREVIKHRGRHYILRCEIHPGLHLTKDSSMAHLRSKHFINKGHFDVAVAHFGIRIRDHEPSAGQLLLLTTPPRIQETGGRVAEAAGGGGSTGEPRTNRSSNANLIGEGLQTEQGAATDAMEQAGTSASRRESQAAGNEGQVTNANDGQQNDNESVPLATGSSVSVAALAEPTRRVARGLLTSSTTSITSEASGQDRGSRKRPRGSVSPNRQAVPDRAEPENFNDSINTPIEVEDIEQPSEVASRGLSDAVVVLVDDRDKMPDAVHGRGSGTLSPRLNTLGESPNKRPKLGVRGMKVSRHLTRPRDDEPESSSSSSANRTHRQSESLAPDLPSTHGELLNMDQSQICAMMDGFEMSRLATTTAAATAQQTGVASVAPRDPPAPGSSGMNDGGAMDGLQGIINRNFTPHTCFHCSTGFGLKFFLDNHLEHCRGQREK